jgi:hypothetical protein
MPPATDASKSQLHSASARESAQLRPVVRDRCLLAVTTDLPDSSRLDPIACGMQTADEFHDDIRISGCHRPSVHVRTPAPSTRLAAMVEDAAQFDARHGPSQILATDRPTVPNPSRPTESFLSLAIPSDLCP